MPLVTVAGRHRQGRSIAVVDGEVQRGHRVATSHVVRRVGRRVCACGIGGSMPLVAVAGRNGFCTLVAVVDGKMECRYRVATRSIRVLIGGCIVGCKIQLTMPLIAVASHYGLCPGVAVAHNQMQLVGAVAAQGRWYGIGGLRRARRVGRPMPFIAVADIGAIDNDGIAAEALPVGGECRIGHHLDATRIGGISVVPMVKLPTCGCDGCRRGRIADGV